MNDVILTKHLCILESVQKVVIANFSNVFCTPEIFKIRFTILKGYLNILCDIQI